MVKRLRHRPFTAVTRVRFPLESFICQQNCSQSSRGLLADKHQTQETILFLYVYADVAQLAEQLICNQQVIGSSPIIGFLWTFSSVGQSNRLITGRSWVRVPEGPLVIKCKKLFGPMAQLVRAPPCHGGGHGFESRLGRLWDLSSAGRASALQAEGHRFEPCRSHRCKASCRRGGTGRRAGLKILWWRHRTGSIPVAGIVSAMQVQKLNMCAQLSWIEHLATDQGVGSSNLLTHVLESIANL